MSWHFTILGKQKKSQNFLSFSFLRQINFEEFIKLSISETNSMNSSININDSFANTTDSTDLFINDKQNSIDFNQINFDDDIGKSFNQSIETAPVYLFCCALSLASISSFLRAGFVMKLIVMILCITFEGCVLALSDLYESYDDFMFISGDR